MLNTLDALPTDLEVYVPKVVGAVIPVSFVLVYWGVSMSSSEMGRSCDTKKLQLTCVPTGNAIDNRPQIAYDYQVLSTTKPCVM